MENVSLYFSDQGEIMEVRVDHEDDRLPVAAGPVIPGMVNVHSHAFQRGLVGKTQAFALAEDDFWSWRQAMYTFVDELTPDSYRKQAEALYREMVFHGYTTVCEFHYLHHGPGGARFSDISSMSSALVDAAKAAGIRLCLLPVLYVYSGFDRSPLNHGQLRFGNSVDEYLSLVESVFALKKDYPLLDVGYAPHSLRAVGESEMKEVLVHRQKYHPDSPFHIHISEQISEVEECVATCGARPVEWLTDTFSVTSAWCMIHATHVNKKEISAIKKSGSVVGLCPTTEADLGDGVFPFRLFADSHPGKGFADDENDCKRSVGSFAIGSDSNVSVSPGEEIRVLEYVQRVSQRTRNIDGIVSTTGAATRRYLSAVCGGRQASGLENALWNVGTVADLVILDASCPLLSGLSPDEMLNAHLLSGNSESIADVIIAGRSLR